MDDPVNKHRELAAYHATLAEIYLQRRLYSEAATECHRAHQNKLIADALVVNGHG